MTKQSFQPAIYIMSSGVHGALYTGVTSNLIQRVHQHRHAMLGGFTKKYSCKFLVYYELHETMESAILREKKIKAGSRHNKIDLIESINPEWKDLYSKVCEG